MQLFIRRFAGQVAVESDPDFAAKQTLDDMRVLRRDEHLNRKLRADDGGRRSYTPRYASLVNLPVPITDCGGTENLKIKVTFSSLWPSWDMSRQRRRLSVSMDGGLFSATTDYDSLTEAPIFSISFPCKTELVCPLGIVGEQHARKDIFMKVAE